MKKARTATALNFSFGAQGGSSDPSNQLSPNKEPIVNFSSVEDRTVFSKANPPRESGEISDEDVREISNIIYNNI